MGGCASKPEVLSDELRPEPLVNDTSAKSPDNENNTNPDQVSKNNGDEKEEKINNDGGESLKEAPLVDVSESKQEEGGDPIPSSETKAESPSSAVIAQLVDDKVETNNVVTKEPVQIEAVDTKEPESAKKSDAPLPAKVEDKAADAPNVTA